MKILILLNPKLKDYHKIGSSFISIVLANQLVKLGNEIGFVANKAALQPLVSPEIKIYDMPDLPTRGYLKEIMERSSKIFKEENYDIFHVNIHQIAALSATAYYLDKDIPVVFVQHTRELNGPAYYANREAASILSNSRELTRLVLVSPVMMDDWAYYLKDSPDKSFKNIRIIENGVLPPVFPKQQLKYDLMTCGGITNSRNILQVLQFVNHYNINSFIVGTRKEGSLKISKQEQEYYEDFMKEVDNKPSCVEYSSYIPNYQVYESLSKSKVYCNFSENEACPLIIIEALSMGTPILCVEEQGTCNLLDESCAVIIPKSEIYRKSLKSRLPVYKKYYDILIEKINKGIITRESVLNKFNSSKNTVEAMTEGYLKVYKELLTEKES